MIMSSFRFLLLLWNTSSGIPTCLFPLDHRLFRLCSDFIRRRVFTECIDKLTKRVHQIEKDTVRQFSHIASLSRETYL